MHAPRSPPRAPAPAARHVSYVLAISVLLGLLLLLLLRVQVSKCPLWMARPTLVHERAYECVDAALVQRIDAARECAATAFSAVYHPTLSSALAVEAPLCLPVGAFRARMEERLRQVHPRFFFAYMLWRALTIALLLTFIAVSVLAIAAACRRRLRP